MRINLDKLEQKRERGGKLEARCPACAELGEDETGNHLFVMDSGKFGCIVKAGDNGKEHRRRIWQLVGDTATDTPRPSPAPRPACRRPARPLPPLQTPTRDTLDLIAKLRGWHTPEAVAGLEVLVKRGQLFTGDIYDDGKTWPAWVATDPTRANAQARKTDGGIWNGIGAKAKSLPSTTTTRVIGASCIGPRPQVWITEGTPDLCAAPIVARLAGLDLDQIAFVCITGAGNDIHADDLPHFTGKAVVIAMHHDADHGKGAVAAHRWAKQLYLAGAAQVRGFDFAGTGGKDLADYLCRLAKPTTSPPAVITLPAPEKAAESKDAASVTASGLDFTGFTKPPATYDGTPWDLAETTIVMFGEDRSVAEVYRKHAKACPPSLPSPPQRGPHNQR